MAGVPPLLVTRHRAGAMRILDLELIVATGAFPRSKEWRTVEREIRTSIESVDWPPGSGTFTLYDEKGAKRGKGSGVVPIKKNCMESLERFGWKREYKRIDATKQTKSGIFALEWETGNISSSHRAMNKMAHGLLFEGLIGGILILPTRRMAYYLTGRIGNYEELVGYFPMWKALPIPNGVLGVAKIEHDAVSLN